MASKESAANNSWRHLHRAEQAGKQARAEWFRSGGVLSRRPSVSRKQSVSSLAACLHFTHDSGEMSPRVKSG